MFSAARIQTIRKSKGLSQEALAEEAGVSLRTIQRVEQGETVPRGYTVQALATALGVPLEALQDEPAPPVVTLVVEGPAPPPALRSDAAQLQLLNLSALGFLLFPFLNLLGPWLLWRARRHDTEHAAVLGRRVLGFQILWQVGCFFTYLLAVLVQLAAHAYHVKLPGLFLGVLVLTYAFNAGVICYYAILLRRGNLNVYKWRL
jgi:transcriptional regulator with XRE-family HTH domain